MEESADGAILAGLADGDLLSLRLAAQVMAHKAELDGHGAVAGYFGRLEAAVQGELASRLTGIRAIVDQPDLGLAETPGTDDRRMIGEYFALLIGNEQLGPELRAACRRLRAVACDGRSDA